MKHPAILLAVLAGLSIAPALSAPRPRKNDAVGLRYLEANYHLYDSLQKQIFRFAETGY